MKVYGALELAQLEWFTNAAKPAAASFIYRVIYVSDLKQIQVSDGTNWIPFLNTSTNQTLSGDITFSGQQIFNGLHRLSVTTNSSTGAITALAPTTPITEFTGAVTSVSGVTSGASGATVMFINRSGSPFTVLDEDAGATAGNRIRTGTGASITLTNNASILLSYAGDSRWHVVGGTGSSSAGGAKNYFVTSSANSNFSQNSVSPWSACTLSFSSGVPSGAPTLTASSMAITASATNPLLASQSSYNLLLTKTGSVSSQYQGFISGELTIDREDLAKVLTGSFSYEVASGTVDFSGTSTQSLEIWIYNTVSGAWTQPAGYRGMNTSSGTGIVTFTFQTDSTAANNKYKIAVITQQTSTTAYTVNFNDFKIGPTAVINGTPVTDWQTYTATLGGMTAIASYCQWKRVGDSIQIEARFSTSAVSASPLTVSLPFNYVIDANKIPIGGLVGHATAQVGVGSVFRFNVIANSGATVLNFGTNLSIGNGSSLLTSSDFLSFFAQVPITGFSSNVQVSSDTDTRVVACRVTGTPTGTITSSSATTANINFPTVAFDTHASYSSGLYTVPVSGIYRVTSHARSTVASGGTFQALGVFVNGSFINNSTVATPTSSLSVQLNTLVSVSSGQTIAVRLWTDGTTPTFVSDPGAQFLNIERLTGPSVIAASETVAMTYTGTATGTLTTGGTNFLATVPTKVFDTHNAYASGLFTVPVSGKYQVSAQLHINAIYASGFTTTRCEIRQAGSASTAIIGQQSWPSGAINNPSRPNASIVLNCVAGDTIAVYGGSDGGTLSYGNQCSISIVRVGN